MTFLLVLAILTGALVTEAYLESEAHEQRQDRKEIERMADRDRQKQRTVLPQRRMRYARVYKPKLKPLRGRAAG